MKKILAAMSSGVDSSVAAKLLIEEGYEVAGATLLLCDGGEKAAEAAGEIAAQLGIEHYVIDGRKYFKDTVIKDFVNGYIECETPNPCVYCNRSCKFELLLKFAAENGFDLVASGHYATVKENKNTNRFEIHKGKDVKKDQSYVLYSLSQDQLARIIMPLGEYTKEQIRAKAGEWGLINADAKDSQDICFIPDGDYAAYIKKYYTENEMNTENAAGFAPGDFVDSEGKPLGRHSGLIRYTIGQRKGLGLSLPAPLYVCEKRKETNQVVLCADNALYRKKVIAGKINLVSTDDIKKPLRVSAKIRYSQNESEGTAYIKDGFMTVEFPDAVRAPAKGQSIVLYDGDSVIGGGIII